VNGREQRVGRNTGTCQKLQLAMCLSPAVFHWQALEVARLQLLQASMSMDRDTTSGTGSTEAIGFSNLKASASAAAVTVALVCPAQPMTVEDTKLFRRWVSRAALAATSLGSTTCL
jgi:hypothetical protein